MTNVGIGFRAKTGKAIAIALAGNTSAPEFVGRWHVLLHDPAVAETGMPHHHVMELPWPEAQRAVRPFERQIEKIATASLAGIARELKARGFTLSAVGVTGSPDRSLEKIGNFHIRAHAAEGILFRRVIEVAAEKRKMPWSSFSDRDILQKAEENLGSKNAQFGSAMAEIGRAAGRPWRKDEQMAAAAVWLILGAGTARPDRRNGA